MDNYIVRIYRRDMEDPQRIAGQVEFVEREEKKAFTGMEELINILASAPGKARCADGRRTRKGRG